MAIINASTLYSLLGNLHSLIPFGLGSSRAFPPLFVQIEVTHRCNAGCPMCYQNSKLSAGQELTFGEIKNIIDHIGLDSEPPHSDYHERRHADNGCNAPKYRLCA